MSHATSDFTRAFLDLLPKPSGASLIRRTRRRFVFDVTVGGSDEDYQMKKSLLIQTISLCFSILFLSFTTLYAQSQKEFKTYEGHKQQFLIDIPEGWSAYEQLAFITGPRATGMVIFSEENFANIKSIENQLENKFQDRPPIASGLKKVKLKKYRSVL